MQTFSFPSKSNPSAKPHVTTITDDGRIGCTCLGWINKKLGKPRECTHTRRVAETEGLTLELRDEIQFVTRGVSRTPTTGTGRTFAEVMRAKSTTPPAPVAPRLAPTSESGFVDPMLAATLDDGQRFEDFLSPRFVMEEKFDGHRVVVAVTPDSVMAWSRPGKSGVALPRRLPVRIIAALKALPAGTYDGETFVPGGQCFDVANLANDDKAVLRIFDVMRLLGADVTRQSYTERRAYLVEIQASGVLAVDGPVGIAESWAVSRAGLDAIFAAGGEGVIVKDIHATYRPGDRAKGWVKIKRCIPAVLTITGFTAAKSGPYSKVELIDADGNTATVKTKNNAMMRRFEAAPDSFIGRKLHVEYETRTPSGSYRTMMFDRLEGE